MLMQLFLPAARLPAACCLLLLSDIQHPCSLPGSKQPHCRATLHTRSQWSYPTTRLLLLLLLLVRLLLLLLLLLVLFAACFLLPAAACCCYSALLLLVCKEFCSLLHNLFFAKRPSQADF